MLIWKKYFQLQSAQFTYLAFQINKKISKNIRKYLQLHTAAEN
jgi:hypothetical protein